MTIEALFEWIAQQVEPQFKLKYKREIEDLASFHLGLSWSELFLQKENKISDEKIKQIKKDFALLQSDLPLAYIVGEKYFYSSSFKVDKNVLIPRSETEQIVEMSLEFINKRKFRIMDLGSGSGCIGLSIAKDVPQSFISLIEASQAALNISIKNGELLKITNCDYSCCEIGVEEILWPHLYEQIDLIVSNPPYITKGDERVERRVHENEPHQALYAEENGLYWIHKFLLWGYNYLKKEGLFIFEFGQNQEDEIQKLLNTMKYEVVEIVKDYSGVNRFFKLKK